MIQIYDIYAHDWSRERLVPYDEWRTRLIYSSISPPDHNHNETTLLMANYFDTLTTFTALYLSLKTNELLNT